MYDALIALLALIGAANVIAAAVAAAWYIWTRRPTPNATVREAVTSIRWSYAVGLFILPPALAGARDGAGPAALGLAIGCGFVLFILLLQWWGGPI